MAKEAKKGKMGCGLAAVVVILVIVAAIFGINEGLGWYGLNCGDEPIWECLQDKEDEGKLTEEQQKSIVVASGPYSYSGYDVVVTAKIPLSGGPVTGSITGACNGKLTGSFAGGDNGAFSGKLAGTCEVFGMNVPASAQLTGSVNKEGKVVPIGFKGGGGGFSHSDSMVLAY